MKFDTFSRPALLGVGLAALAAASFATPVRAAGETEDLTFAVVQTQRMSVEAKAWEPTVEYFAKTLGVKVNFYQTSSYAAVVEAMMAGFVDFAKLGPKIYIVAAEKSKGSIRPVATLAKPPTPFNPEPCACYFGKLITKKGSEFTTIASLKGAVLALTDPGSTSGSALPRALFPQEIGGASLEDYFAKIFYTGSHDNSGRAVYTGKADAAFVSDSALLRAVNRGEFPLDGFNFLWTSPAITLDNFAVNAETLSPEMIEKIRAAALAMHLDEDGKKALESLGYVRLTPATDASYDSVRKILAAKAKMKEGN